ncbi:MAG: hypothetical protein COB77_05410 [Gammaproteobacteria bacterium]|nr:MAG: hypothetical protein COB77_05410 [Gammaproteobacteria bacterium]
MNKSVVVVGLGEMGSVFARGFLRTGFTVHPVTRDMQMQQVADAIEMPELVLLAVGETDLHAQLAQVPETWKDHLVLLQNEILPGDWQRYNVEPTVISVWFEKKKGQDSKVIIPSPVYGKHAQTVVDALASIDITTHLLTDATTLAHELVLKNVYILTTNIAGLAVAGNVGQLWDKHNQLAIDVANEVIKLQEVLSGQSLDSQTLIDGMVNAFNGDREHMCMGRSAPVRLKRALAIAQINDIKLDTLEKISRSQV